MQTKLFLWHVTMTSEFVYHLIVTGHLRCAAIVCVQPGKVETSKQFARRVIFIFRVKHVALAKPELGFQILGAITNRIV